MSESDEKLLINDASKCDEFSRLISALHFEIYACGGDGKIEKSKLKELAPEILKIVVNYL